MLVEKDCFYCQRDERQEALMMEIGSLSQGTAFLFRDQKNLGRCIVAFKEHKKELFALTAEERAGFMNDVAAVAQAITELYGCDKINYAAYGDKVTHLHFHLVPKYENGLSWGEPFSDKLEKVLLTDEEYAKMITALKEKLHIA